MAGNQIDGANRRKFLQAISAIGAVGLAGCGQQNGDGTEPDGTEGTPGSDVEGTPAENAERVPVLELSYMGNAPRSPELEAGVGVLVDNMAQLGVEIETNPMDGLTYVLSGRGDERIWDITYMYGNPTPDRLNPMRQVERLHIRNAGESGGSNPTNYTSCEVSQLIDEALRAANQAELQEKVTEIMQLAAEDYQQSVTTNVVDVGAIRSNQVEPAGAGLIGYSRNNALFYIESSATNDENALISDFSREGLSSRRQIIGSLGLDTLVMYNNLVNSPLVMYDPETLEQTNVLAETVETSQEGDSWSVTVTLRDGLSFQNGDSLTAEDVKFTFDLANEQKVLMQQSNVDYQSSEVIDDRTVRFDFDHPDLGFILQDISQWGILHPGSWDGATENPEEFIPDTVVGSGPFEVDTFERDQSVRLTPSQTDHPVFDPSHDVIFVPFDDAQTKLQAFKAGEINVATSIRPALVPDLEVSVDDLDTAEQQGWSAFQFRPQHAQGPGKFNAFRQAMTMVPNRRLINELTNNGRGRVVTEAAVGEMTPPHPYFPDDMPHFTDKERGDVEGARRVLAEAGFTWDSDGRLHYPPGADLEPLWPAKSNPRGEDFPCLDDETGEYTG